MAQSYIKDPDATLDYTVDWSQWLGEDTIDVSDWVVATGLTEDSATNTTTTATIWLTGGVPGQNYDVTNRITTTGGRVDDRTIRVRCAAT
ncbi:MAG: hypothetical protein ACOYD4_06805 [Solirubrobacterales bacterium]